LVWVGTITALLTIDPNLLVATGKSAAVQWSDYRNFVLHRRVCQFCGSVAEGQVKSDALRSTKSDTIARKLLPDGSIQEVSSTTLHQGERVKVIAGISSDGEVLPAGG